MCSAGDNAALPALGFPIRESADQRLFSASPRLIAAVHALLRLQMPRHPPSALTILTVIRVRSKPDSMNRAEARLGDTRSACCAVFKDREEGEPPPSRPAPSRSRPTGRRRSLKTRQHARARKRAPRQVVPVDVLVAAVVGALPGRPPKELGSRAEALERWAGRPGQRCLFRGSLERR